VILDTSERNNFWGIVLVAEFRNHASRFIPAISPT
jgi:hypothetical protein